MQEKQVEILDLRGLKCPMPVLKAKKAMQPLGVGDRVWIETTDPLAVIDIPAFCNESGHELLQSEDQGDFQRFLVVKGEA